MRSQAAPHRQVPRGETGFTLLEVIVAVALLTVILGAVYGTFFMSHKALDGADETLVKLQEGRMTLDTIGREIDSALYSKTGKYSSFTIEDRDIYDKQTSRLIFTTFSPLTPGLSLVSYYVDEKDGRMTLMKKIRSAFVPDNPEEKGVELVEDLQAFTVEARLNGDWVRTWDAVDANAVPDRLRVTITFKLGDKPYTLYEIMSPKTGKGV